MVINTRELTDRFGFTLGRNLMCKARKSIYHKTKLITMVIPSGNRHGKHDRRQLVVQLESKDMVEYYEGLKDNPKYAHSKKRMLANKKLWESLDEN